MTNPDASMTPKLGASFTTISYPGQKMGKEYTNGPGGTRAETDGAGFYGYFRVEMVESLSDLNTVLESYDLSQIMVHGVPRNTDDPTGYIHNGTPQPYMDLVNYFAIQRTKKDLTDPVGLAIGSLDSDFDHAPSWTRFIQTPQQCHDFLVSVVPELADVGLLVRPSGSNGVTNPDGTPFKTTRNFHTHFICQGGERRAILERLHAVFAHRGYGWVMIGSSGSLLDRSPVDLALRTANQPLFAAKPRIVSPVLDRRPPSLIKEGRTLRLDDLPDLGSPTAVFDALKAAADLLLRQAQVKNCYVKNKAREALALTIRPTRKQAKEAISVQKVQATERERARAGKPLGPDFVIHTMRFGALTVRQIISDRDKYHEAKTKDPMQPDYRGGAQTGILYLTGNSLPVLVSLAHGQSVQYFLEGEDFVPAFDIDVLLNRKPQPSRKTDALNTLTPTVTLAEGSHALRNSVTSFFLDTINVAVRGTPGVGKTYVTMAELAKLQPRANDNYVLYLAPMVSNCEESYDAYTSEGGTNGMVFYGRGQIDRDTAPAADGSPTYMCVNPDHVARRLAYGTGNRSLCHECPLRRKMQCGYDRQLERVDKELPRVILATHAFAHYPIPGWEPDRIILDESLSNGGLDMEVSTPSLPIAQLRHHPEGAANVLKAHINIIPDHGSYPAVMEHRYKTEVLQAIIDKEPVVWVGSKAIKAVRRAYLYSDKPTLMLDGTFRRSLAELMVGPVQREERIDVYRNLRVVQVLPSPSKVGKPGWFGDNHLAKSATYQEDFGLVGDSYDVRFTTKRFREALGKLEDDSYAHLGGAKGLNRWVDAQTAIVMLYGQPNMQALIAMAEVLGGAPVEGEDVIETRYIMLRDGTVHPTKVHWHTNELVSELLRQAREDQILQLIDRIRPTRAQKEKYLLFCCPVPLDLPVDLVLAWDDIKPSQYDKSLLKALTTGSGIVPESPKQAPRFRPDIWDGEWAAKNHYKHWCKDWQNDLEQVVIQERNGRVREVFGRRLPDMGGGFPNSIIKAKPYKY
ncbi:hypothetical protein [Loktanella salsilacus]|uniref:hypothetical protein n=1 Tax=Loktanella salsilacus TaxID=195913 RepID=UPI0020B7B5AF|nr:hypothetical protein [Loktanella salsilacus]UTH45328.1 hypothetical protein KBK07_04435 [Loktanella salsilacus]